MAATTAQGTVQRWVDASRPRLGARAGFLAFAALGHFAFLGSLKWEDGLPFVLWLSAPNLLVLATVTLAPRRPGWLRYGPTAAVFGASATTFALACGGAALIRLVAGDRHDFGDVVGGLLLGAFGGLAGGAFGALVATPLCRTVAHWRAEATPRRALDAWATLAGMATVFAVTRPFNESHSAMMCAAFPRSENCHGLNVAQALHLLDLGMAGAAVLLAAAVLVVEWRLRRLVARARREGRTRAVAGRDAVSLATTRDETMVAWEETPDAGYRDAAEHVVALVPKTLGVSWRLVAMPLVIAACLASLANSSHERPRLGPSEAVGLRALFE